MIINARFTDIDDHKLLDALEEIKAINDRLQGSVSVQLDDLPNRLEFDL